MHQYTVSIHSSSVIFTQ